jgi:hypothetical protein
VVAEPCGFGLDRGAGAGAFAPGGRGAGTSRIVEIGGRVTRRCLRELVASRPEHPSSRRAADATGAGVVRARALHGGSETTRSRAVARLPSPRSRGPAAQRLARSLARGSARAARCLGRVAHRNPRPGNVKPAPPNSAREREARIATAESGLMTPDQTLETSSLSLRHSTFELSRKKYSSLSLYVHGIVIYSVAPPFRW